MAADPDPANDTSGRVAPGEGQLLSTARTSLRRLFEAGADAHGAARVTRREVLDRVCDLAVTQLQASAAVVTLLPSAGVLVVAGASSTMARELEQTQFDLSEGPTCEADRTQQTVLVADLNHEPVRWPGLARDTRWAHVAAVFSIPLRLGASRFGAMTLYRERPGHLGTPGRAALSVLADLVVELLIDTYPGSGGDGEDDVDLSVLLNHELAGQAVVYQAQGKVMVQLGCSLAEALARMRARAYAEELTLNALSHQIVEGTTTFVDGV